MNMIDKKSSDEIDKTKFVQLICEKYSVVKKSAVKKFVVTKSVVEKYSVTIKQSVAIKFDMQQNQNEFIKKYYQRIHDVLVAIDRKNILLFVVVFRN